MGRLVDIEDVKALINGLDSLPWEEEVDDLLKTIPTAYSVEKVVADLEEESFPTHENYSAIWLDKAITIVKRGGVE